jgi:outer membrane protein OmpA-like peptidoglycan-associated protein
MKKLCVLLVVLTGISAIYAQSAGNGDEPLYIVFPANSADLKAVRGELAIQNSQTFTKVAQLLLENPKYRILVDGHANPVIGTREEENTALKPLSAKRAQAAVDFLVTYYGVERRRLVPISDGSKSNLSGNSARLNRQVSFSLIPPR